MRVSPPLFAIVKHLKQQGNVAEDIVKAQIGLSRKVGWV